MGNLDFATSDWSLGVAVFYILGKEKKKFTKKNINRVWRGKEKNVW